ncbi:MAG: DUF523 and DUF1722 domain-containing protein [Myxococcales bacterium]|nr:DUF523 and DUF1722 domain-containing protein [Myxococcales bacterium]
MNQEAPIPAQDFSAGGVIRIGISACILGQEVRYNGGHKLDRFIRDTLGAFVEFVPVCPEVDIGLGVPRETLRLVQDDSDPDGEPLMQAPKSGADHSKKMLRYAQRKVAELSKLDLCGYIVQKGSPSCGMERVRVYPRLDGGMPRRDGRGLFTRVLMQKLPLLPVEEDGRLNDPLLRENFIERVFAYRRLRQLFAGRWTIGQLVSFHGSEKLLLMAHSPGKALGQLVAKAKAVPRAQLKDDYSRLFLETLARRSTVRKHVNVLQHIVGYFRKRLDDDSRREVHDLIEAYRNQLVPLVVPVTLIRHHVRKLEIDYLMGQSYLSPHPRELMLRNHA